MLPKAKPKAAALRMFHPPGEVRTIAGCMSQKTHPKPSPLAGNIFLPKIHPFGKTSTSYRHVAHWWHVIVPVPCFRGAKSPRMVSVAGISRFRTQPIIIYILDLWVKWGYLGGTFPYNTKHLSNYKNPSLVTRHVSPPEKPSKAPSQMKQPHPSPKKGKDLSQPEILLLYIRVLC